MDIEARCYLCQIKRLMAEIELLDSNPIKEIELAKEILKYYASTPEKRSAILGFEARKVLRNSNNQDPYATIKSQMNTYALQFAQEFEDILLKIADPYECFRKACLGAVLGNLMEFFLLEHSFECSLDYNLREFLDTQVFYIDNTQQAFNLLNSARNVIFLPDNAGEIVFDKIFIKILKVLFPQLNVIVGVKSAPIINDATLLDAQEISLDDTADQIISTGINSIGLFYDLTSPEFQTHWHNADLIIEKGMGHFETSDFPQPLTPHKYHLFKVKCSTVGNKVHAPLGANIAKLV